jgi:hypothetical protein
MSKRLRYKYHGNVGTFLHFARDQGNLPATFTGLKRAPLRIRFIRQMRVFSPADMATLSNDAKLELVSDLAIIAIASVRVDDVRRLDWRQVKLEKGVHRDSDDDRQEQGPPLRSDHSQPGGLAGAAPPEARRGLPLEEPE